MKELLKKITEINEKHWAMAIHIPTNYKERYDEYMIDMEAAIQKYAKSLCDCTEEETTGCISEYVCNNCKRVQTNESKT